MPHLPSLPESPGRNVLHLLCIPSLLCILFVNSTYKHLIFLAPLKTYYPISLGFPGGASGKEPACQCRSSIPGLGRSPGEGNGKPLQYSCLGNRIVRGA